MFDKELLNILEESSSKGESTTIFHVFSGTKEIGGLILSGQSIVQVGDLSPIIYGKVRDHLVKADNNMLYSRVSQFLLEEQDQVYKVVVETLDPPPSLYVFGAGHVGQAVALIGALLGYRVVVIDDRKEFLTIERFPNPNIELWEENYDRISNNLKLPANSAVVIVTRGHQYDETCLKQIINFNIRYIGMIGSRRRVVTIFQRLVKEGIDEELLKKVHAPIGLKIDAISPQEIAVAIMAEIIDVMNGLRLYQDRERRQ